MFFNENIEEHIETKQLTQFWFKSFLIFSPGLKGTDPLNLFHS